MLKDIESITSEYLYHCEIHRNAHLNSYIKFEWYADKKYGHATEYNKKNAVTGKWVFNIKGRFSVGRFETWDGEGWLKQIDILDKKGVLLESQTYYKSGTLFSKDVYTGDIMEEYKFHENGVCSNFGSYHNNTEFGVFKMWDQDGKLINSYEYKNRSCLIL